MIGDIFACKWRLNKRNGLNIVDQSVIKKRNDEIAIINNCESAVNVLN